MMWLAPTILLLVTVQRLIELVIARRNTARLLARGGIETGAAHYPLIVGFHVPWLVGLWLLAWGREVNGYWLAAFLLLQIARAWVIVSLGERWTTRIITIPNERLVAVGPYRYVRHPNYLVVAAEVFVLPMVFGLFWFALAALMIDAALMWIRIRAEDAALASSRLSQSAGGPS